MKKWVCTVCGYVCEGEAAPEKCPICKAPASKFQEMKGEKVYADEHKIGVANGLDERVIEGLRENFNGECSEVGMYLAMSARGTIVKVIRRLVCSLRAKKQLTKKLSMLRKFAELLGEVVTDSTKKNLEMRVEAENGATAGKINLAKKAKELGL